MVLHGYKMRDNFFAKSITTNEPFKEKALKGFFEYKADRGQRVEGAGGVVHSF